MESHISRSTRSVGFSLNIRSESQLPLSARLPGELNRGPSFFTHPFFFVLLANRKLFAIFYNRWQ
jgi:hypothetical protein